MQGDNSTTELEFADFALPDRRKRIGRRYGTPDVTRTYPGKHTTMQVQYRTTGRSQNINVQGNLKTHFCSPPTKNTIDTSIAPEHRDTTPPSFNMDVINISSAYFTKHYFRARFSSHLYK